MCGDCRFITAYAVIAHKRATFVHPPDKYPEGTKVEILRRSGDYLGHTFVLNPDRKQPWLPLEYRHYRWSTRSI